MVTWQFLALVRRRPLIALLGVVLTGLLIMMIHSHAPIYYTSANAIFLNPQPPTTKAAILAEQTNPLDGTNPELISAAGVVARTIAGGPSKSLSGSDAVSLVGQGVTHGYTVTLPNSGGQWVYLFDRPVLEIQVVGRSPQEVTQLLAAAMNEVRTDLEALESRTGSSSDQWIRVLQNPQVPAISQGDGSPTRAMAAALILGLLLTLSLLYLLQDRGPKRRPARFRHRRQVDVPPAQAETEVAVAAPDLQPSH